MTGFFAFDFLICRLGFKNRLAIIRNRLLRLNWHMSEANKGSLITLFFSLSSDYKPHFVLPVLWTHHNNNELVLIIESLRSSRMEGILWCGKF